MSSTLAETNPIKSISKEPKQGAHFRCVEVQNKTPPQNCKLLSKPLLDNHIDERGCSGVITVHGGFHTL